MLQSVLILLCCLGQGNGTVVLQIVKKLNTFKQILDFRRVINKKIVVVTGRSAAAAPLLKHSGHSKGHSKVDPKGDSKRAEAKIITKKVGTTHNYNLG